MKPLSVEMACLLGIHNKIQAVGPYGSPMDKNIYDPPMAKTIYGPPVAKNTYGPSMAKIIYEFELQRIRHHVSVVHGLMGAVS